MMIGNARVLTCPFCGEKKEIISLLSGNTFGADNWSDGFLDAPMCPEPSPIQKCPHCGKCYLICEQNSEEYSKEESHEKGILGFYELKDAYKQLVDTVSSENIPVVLQTIIFAYNNEFTRKNVIPSAEDLIFFRFCLQTILYYKDELDPVLVGEYLREMAKFSECIETLNKITPKSPYQEFLISQIIEHAEAKNGRVFLVPDFQDEMRRRRLSVKDDPVPDLCEYIITEEKFTIDGLVSFAEKSLENISDIKIEEAHQLSTLYAPPCVNEPWDSETLSTLQGYNIIAYEVIKKEATRINTLYRNAFENIDDKVWDTDNISVVYYGEFVGLGILSIYAYMRELGIPVEKLKEIKLLSVGHEMNERCDCFYDYTNNTLKQIFPSTDIVVRKGLSCLPEYAETTSPFTIHLMDEKYLGHGTWQLPGFDTMRLIEDLEERSCSLFDIIISITDDSFNHWDKQWWFGNTQKLANGSCKLDEDGEEWYWMISANFDIPEAHLPESDDRKVLMRLGIDDRMPGDKPHEAFYNTCYDLCKVNPTVGTFNVCLKWINEYQNHLVGRLHEESLPFLSNLYNVLKISVNYKAGVIGDQMEYGMPYINYWPEQSPLYLLNKAVCLKNGLAIKSDVEQATNILEKIAKEYPDWTEKNPEVYRQLALCYGASIRIEDAHKMFEKYAAHENCKCLCSAKMQIARYHKMNGNVFAWLDFIEEYTKEGTGCSSCHSTLNYDSLKKICPKVQLAAAFDYEDGKNVLQDDEKAFKFYMQVALQGEVSAEFMVGSYLSQGKGCVKNVEEAKKWLTIAANKGFRNAQGLLSVIFRDEGNLPKVLYWLSILCTPEDYKTQYEIARILLLNNLPGARKWLESSAKGGYSESQYLLAVLTDDEESKILWLKNAARQGHKLAQSQLNKLFGEIYDTTDDTETDYQKEM